jgi:5-methylcytosine-specific restriction endonuclease McrA
VPGCFLFVSRIRPQREKAAPAGGATRGTTRGMDYRPRPTPCLVEPPPAVEAAADFIRLAVETLEHPLDPSLTVTARRVAGRRQLALAHAYARAIDWTAMEWFWLEAGLEWKRRHDKRLHVGFDGQRASTKIPLAVKRAVLSRDGWRCRYCSIRVVSSDVLTKLEKLLPAALPMWPAEMGPTEVTTHAAQCVMRLTWDHVTPRSAGGVNDVTNIVASCGTCNFAAKGDCTIDELSLVDPRSRPPMPPTEWDGLDGRLGAARIGTSGG